MSHIKYPYPATTGIRPGSNGQVPRSGTRQNDHLSVNLVKLY